MEPKRRKYNKLYCPHCEQEVSKSTWYVHHSQFYDEVRKSWRKENTSIAMPDQEFDFGSSDEFEDDGCELPTDVSAATLSDEGRPFIITNVATFIGIIIII